MDMIDETWSKMLISPSLSFLMTKSLLFHSEEERLWLTQQREQLVTILEWGRDTHI